MEMIWVEGLPDELKQRAREAVAAGVAAHQLLSENLDDPEAIAAAMCADVELRRVLALLREFVGVDDA